MGIDSSFEGLPSRRVVLLGASNVRISLSAMLRTLLKVRHEPLDVYAVCGHGRSYGQWSWIPFRGLPGITQCGLWEALGIGPGDVTVVPQTPRPLALITDVGNDLLFGVQVPQILEWVALCCEKLSQLGSHTVITLPPWERLIRLSAPRYYATRYLFFPGSKLTWKQMLDSVTGLRAGLTDIAARHNAPVIDPPLAWYGVDPIHIRWSKRVEAWTRCFESWPAAEELPSPAPATNGTSAAKRLLSFSPKLLRPHHRRIFGRFQTTPQPVFRGQPLTLSLY